MGKPRVFIGSSTEGLDVAKAVEVNLKEDAEPVLWKDVFAPSLTTIENLENVVDQVEFAVLVVTPDDLREKNEKTGKVPRDNVVFEAGLFMGGLGRDRTFLVKFKKNGNDPQLPTDLQGLTVVSVDNRRSNGEMIAAVRPEMYKVLLAIKKAPRRQPAGDRSKYQNFLLDEDQFLHAIASWPPSSKAITIALPHTTWVWPLFPALLCWRLAKTPVLVYTLAPFGGTMEIKKEKARRELLGKLGVHVQEVMNIEKTGVFRKTNSLEEDCVIICNETGGENMPFAIQYDGMIHSQATISLMEGVVLPQRDTDDESLVPQLKIYNVQDVIEKLRRGVDQYSSPDVGLEVSTVKTNDLYLSTPFVRSFKYRQIELLFNEYKRVGITPFQAMAVQLTSGEQSIVIPPVVEIHDDKPIVIGGTTRTKFCRDRGIEQFHCIRVTGVQDPLPFTPVPIDQVSVAERSLPPTERMKDFEYSLFRHIEKAIRPY